MASGQPVAISSSDYWVKVIGMLQQNWALVSDEPASGCVIHFIDDGSQVFDRMAFETVALAERALLRNGFDRYTNLSGAREFLSPPAPPFSLSEDPAHDVYSSGRCWR